MTSISERLYRKLSGDEDGAQANDITQEAADAVAPNFFVLLFASVATKTGDQLFSPRLILTWLLASIGSLAAAIAVLVPVREAFALLPQLFAGAIIQRSPIQKWYWIGGSLVQGLCVLLILLAALFLDSATLAGWVVVALLAIFSCGRVFNSISSKSLRGKILPKKRRGMAGGTASAVAGAATLGVALYFLSLSRDQPATQTLALILGIAAALWWLGAAIFIRLKEFPSELSSENRNLPTSLLNNLSELKNNPAFRRFLLVRTGLIGNALVLPLIVLLIFDNSQGSGTALGVLIGGSGLAAMCSSFIWGKLADRSSRKLLFTVALAGGITSFLGLAGKYFIADGVAQSIVLGFVFFLLAVIHQGTRIGRKTYLIDFANSDNRTQLVAVSNTFIGIALLFIGGAVGTLAGIHSLFAVALCGICSLVASFLALGMKEA